jgi:hypothetical protein
VTAGSSAATVQVVPIDGVSAVSLTVNELADIMNGIHLRRNTLLCTQQSKKNAVNAMSDIGAVINYDVTAGW